MKEENKRSTLTLNFKGSKNTKLSFDKEKNEDNFGKNQLLLRQQQLMNSQNMEERNRLINKNKRNRNEKIKVEIKKEEIESSNVKSSSKDNVRSEINNNRNDNKNINTERKDFKNNRNFKKEDRNTNKKDLEKENKKEETVVKKPVIVDSKNIGPLPEKKKFEKKEKVFEAEEDSVKKKLLAEKINVKAEKYKKNIHTYVFNEDEEDKSDIIEKRKFFKSAKKKNKKNHQENLHQKIYHEVQIPDFITISNLADRMSEKKSDLVKKLFTMGMPTTANQVIDADTAELIVVEFGHKPIRVSDSDVEKVLSENEGKEFVSRSPVVTVMGHVDHGKTSLLDALRSSKIAEGESGGITQHIGASRIEVQKGKFITFIDTPGHEAFTEMRIRGANITDIVVLVVAADDGIKDQTIEAINHTKAAKVPMIVAVNKIDKDGADPERVKQELLQYDVIAEEFGGDVMFANVSAKTGLNLDKLMEAILLQAEMLDLKAPVDCPAEGAVIEARVDLQKGVIASILVQKGILKIGDIVVAGTTYGKIKKMVDDKRKSQMQAEPSIAVEILGLNSVPKAGDTFNVVSSEKEARDIISYRERKEKEALAAKNGKRTLESMLKKVGSNKKELSVVVKADVSGSIEAINSSLIKLGNDEVSVSVVHSATGAINESDINLASISNALVVGFNVRASNKAVEIAKDKGVEIRYYSIIYNIIDEIKDILSGLLDSNKKEETVGQAEIRNVFKLSSFGTVAGCYVLTGEIQRNQPVRLIRDGIVIYTGKIKALKRFKDDVKEVKTNYECGISIDNYADIKEKDIIECYKITEEKRELQ